MASSCIVKILEIAQIKPSPESPNSSIQSSLPLTFFDTYWFKLSPVERLFFYQLDSSTPALFSSEIIPQLKRSLSLTLNHYLPIAGDLKWPSNVPKPFIKYSPNDGVSLTVAESDADFDRLTGNGIYEALELHPLIPQLITSDDSASVLAVQITLFPNKGFSIGITAHHTVLDGKTTSMFMKSWAYLCKQGNKENSDQLPQGLIPCFDREIIKDPTGFDLDILYLNQKILIAGGNKSLKISTNKGKAPNLVRATVTITREDLKKLKQRVLSNSKSSDSSKQLHVSSFVLTLGYLTSCIIKARGGAGDRITARARGGAGDRITALAFTADCRLRLQPPIPETYFGNCNSVQADLSNARGYLDIENGFEFAVEKVSNMVKGLTEKGVLDGAKEKMSIYFDVLKEPEGSVQIISVAGSPRFNLYETDFGWGRPWKVVVVSIDKTEAISMVESRDGSRGIEVGLALKKPEMEKLLSMFLKDV